GLMTKLARRLHNFGRNGAVTFGLSAIDIALWDIAGRIAGQPLHALLGGAGRARVPAYASLLRYGDTGSVARNAAEAIRRGYRHVKLHEVHLACIAAARAAIPPDVPLMLDINCAWGTVEEAVAFGRAVAAPNTRWVEEPTWPPEDFGAIAKVRAAGHTAIAAGENCGGVEEFRRLFAAGAVDYAQPSVTKVGGVSAMMAVAALAREAGVAFMPHCPYFGAGLLATLHILAAHPVETPIEVYFADLSLPPYGAALEVRDGFMAVPNAPGLGLEPDPAALAAAI
ncbi:MAG TPA: mandelate racemase/muconate lactonizing enzyme family protein, partial [Acetobacteraceae bacterium]|nr:mandelate racemase/muconate lactonizing enzyme family protein [Acetobacteraceae bacterium]